MGQREAVSDWRRLAVCFPSQCAALCRTRVISCVSISISLSCSAITSSPNDTFSRAAWSFCSVRTDSTQTDRQAGGMAGDTPVETESSNQSHRTSYVEAANDVIE